MSAYENINASNITRGTVNEGRLPTISKSKISATGQWQSTDIPDLDAAKVTTGVFDSGRIPSIDASNITGTLSESTIPDIPASKVTSGTLDANRIPDLDAAKVTTGELDINRIPDIPASTIVGQLPTSAIPDLNASKLTSGVLDSARIPTTDLLAVTQHDLSGYDWMPNHLFRTHNMFTNNFSGTSSSYLIFQSSDVRDTGDIPHGSLNGVASAFPKCVSLLIPQGWTATQVFISQWTTGTYEDFVHYTETSQAVEVVEVVTTGMFGLLGYSEFDAPGTTRTATPVTANYKANNVLNLSSDTLESSIHTGASLPRINSFVIKIGALSNPNSLPMFYQGGWVKIEEID